MSKVVYFNYINSKLIFTVDGAVYSLTKTNKYFNKIVRAIKANDSEEAVRLFKLSDVVETLKDKANVEYKNGNVYVNGEVLHNTIAVRVAVFAENGLPIQPILNFIANLQENPSFNSRTQLYTFLEHMDIVLTDDGCFLAYKSVRNDYMDKYSGNFSNKVGSVLEMKRTEVDDNTNNHCSKGFHVGSLKYSGPGGWYHSPNDRVMIVKVNPRDAVSVPSDHSCQKLRVCRYEVLAEFNEELSVPLYKSDGGKYEYSPNSYDDEGYYEEFDGWEDDDYYDEE